MGSSGTRRFFEGAAAGGVLAAIVLALAGGSGDLSGQLERAAGWTMANLGWSVPFFTLAFAAFARDLRRLRRALADEQPVEEVASLDHLTEVWTGLVFGVGVIWTAIGMRAALVDALGAPLGGDDAGALLARMVDGGILLALSSTIFGGAAGYGLRVVKSVRLGAALRRRYERERRRDLLAIREQLAAIEQRLQPGARALEAPETPP